MILSDTQIFDALDKGNLSIEPLQGKQVQPASIDLRLGGELRGQIADGVVNVADASTYPESVPVDGMTIQPGESLLAGTVETLRIPKKMCGVIYGRSSIGRLGLFVHNAGFVDSGFEGNITLELFNSSGYPIELKENMRICQLVLHQHWTPPTTGYAESGKYQDQETITESKLHEDFD